jgi:hypothetical protein
MNLWKKISYSELTSIDRLNIFTKRSNVCFNFEHFLLPPHGLRIFVAYPIYLL